MVRFGGRCPSHTYLLTNLGLEHFETGGLRREAFRMREDSKVSMPDEVPWDRAPHTAAKHDLYRHYLDAWFPILIQAFQEVTVAEGFAGPGVYKEGRPGSPIFALRAFKQSPAARVCRRARFVFVDHAKRCVDSLQVELGKELGQPITDTFDDGRLRVLVRK